MRYSRMFAHTRREAPAGTESTSARLLSRAGFIQQLGAGIYTMLPLGHRASSRILQILREEMVAIGCEELAMPVIQPADLWKESGRWEEVGHEMLRSTDRQGRDLAIAPTHEEVATDLVRREVQSYRQLPVQFFQFQTKFRDEPRPRGGLIRTREFLMKDAYSFHASEEDFLRFYHDCHKAYLRIFARVGLDVVVVESGGGYMGGAVSHEFMSVSDAGEDLILICSNCGFAANQEFATPRYDLSGDPPEELEEVATPGMETIRDVAEFLDLSPDKTLKAVFYEVQDQLVFVVIRGDFEVNSTKLASLLGVEYPQPASPELIRASGAVPGYASPVGLKRDVRVLADESALTPNLVAGANREGYHLKNVNLGRDYQASQIASFALLEDGEPCPECGASLSAHKAIEVGNIFTLGTKYTEPQHAEFLDENDDTHLILMGSYGIGIGRLMASVAERHHDERGHIWPASVAPYDVHLVSLGRGERVHEVAESLYLELECRGVTVLYDDRDESAGIKFNDADLIGLPLRITVSNRSLRSGGAELKRRRDSQDMAEIVPVTEVPARVQSEMQTSCAQLLADAESAALRSL